MDLLKRSIAPVLPEAWSVIDDEARRVLKLNLAGRKLVDLDGPHGWKLAAVNTGRLEMIDGKAGDPFCAGVRKVQPLVEVRASIRLSLMELDSVARGATDPDLAAVIRAAEGVARTEDGAIFNGYARAGIAGIIPSSPHRPITVVTPGDFPRAIVEGKEVLRQAGVGGPYALALGPGAYDEIAQATEDGYPLRKRIERTLIDGPIVWAPAVDGAVLLSARGGDFQLTVGQDLSIGFAYHDKQEVELFLTETFTFRILERAAALHLVRPRA
jgi:uncharacterized linocin/CFP29 family protein